MWYKEIHHYETVLWYWCNILHPLPQIQQTMNLYSNTIKVNFGPTKTSRILIWAIVVFFVTENSLLGFNNKVEAADAQSRTEANCTIGMVKGEAKAECRVPIPNGCAVAQFPGYPEPWVDISKGGGTSCRFDEKQTDWKTSIVGSCQACTTEQCTGRFIVMFNCANNVPPANPGTPGQK
jgi:hypothetical protein